jgi:2-polyprenyl-3-methyl-5-hydroxy-6-metoxy-1,4-benzoquinol methylase
MRVAKIDTAVSPGPAHTGCPACEAPVDQGFDHLVYAPFSILQCSSCGYRFVGDPVSEEQLSAYYANSYGVEHAERYRAMQAQNARDNARRIIPLFKSAGLPDGSAMVDVGAGFGYLVAALRARGYDAEGVEPSQDGATFAGAMLQVPVRAGVAKDLVGEHRRFQAVTLCDVIEHMRRPRALLKDCFDLLEPGGLLAVKTDHFESAVARLMGLNFYRLTPVEHIALITPATLAAMAEKEGFKLIRSVTWSPGYAIRWALKHRLLVALGRRSPPPDPLTKHLLGPTMSWLGRLSEPFFGALAPLIDRGGHGSEFISVFQRH